MFIPKTHESTAVTLKELHLTEDILSKAKTLQEGHQVAKCFAWYYLRESHLLNNSVIQYTPDGMDGPTQPSL